MLLTAACPGIAEAESLTPQQVLQMDFVLPGVPFPFGSPDTFVFGIEGRNVEPIRSFTVSLFDRDELLGTFSSVSMERW